MFVRSKYPTKIINCPDCGVKCNYVANSLAEMPFSYPGTYHPHQRGSRECLERWVKNLQKENKRLSATFTSKEPLEMIRAKCEQYWKDFNTFYSEEIHTALEFIHQLTWSAEKDQQDVEKRVTHVVGIINECRLFIEQEMPNAASDIRLKDYIQSKLNKVERLQNMIQALKEQRDTASEELRVLKQE